MGVCAVDEGKTGKSRNEATAAALTFSLSRPQVDSKILVFDFGGGTLDISILEIGEGVCEVIATAGDGQLGGDDFDQIIIDYILEQVQKQFGASFAFSSLQQIVVKEAAIKAKIDLSVSKASNRDRIE